MIAKQILFLAIIEYGVESALLYVLKCFEIDRSEPQSMQRKSEKVNSTSTAVECNNG